MIAQMGQDEGTRSVAQIREFAPKRGYEITRRGRNTLVSNAADFSQLEAPNE